MSLKHHRAAMLSLISRECANSTGSACRGIDILSTFCSPLDTCLIRQDLPCRYFERCLLPLAQRRAEYAGVSAEYARIAAGNWKRGLEAIERPFLRERTTKHPFCGTSQKVLEKLVQAERFCECGAPLVKGHRFCPECKKKHRRESGRERWKRFQTKKRGSGLTS